MTKTMAPTTTEPSLFEVLQKEFCPPLDTSLLAALVGEIVMGADDTPMVPSTQQISQLRNDLRVLATQADEFQLSQIEDLENEFSVRREWKLEQTAPSSFEETESSGSSSQSLESPLAFLQGLLPHIPVHEIIAALEDSEKSGKEFDMWELVSTLLSELAIKDLEERGSAGLDVDGDHHKLDWDTVTAKKSTKQRGNHRSPTKVALFDVRQTRHIRAAGVDRKQDIAAPDPWTQVNSLATRLSELLPSHSAPFFSSYFHNPTHRSPYVACRAALTTICEKQKSKSETDAAVIVTILELAYPDYQELDGEQQTRLLSDIELSVQVTRGRFDDCLSIIDILVVLNFDANNNYLEMGVYHLSPRNSSPAKAITVPASTNTTLNSSVASKLPPPSSPPIPTKPPSYKEKPPPDKNKPSPFQWQAVPQKNKSEFTPHPLAVHIPAYARDVNGIKVKGAGGGNGRKGSVGGRYMTARLGGSVSQTSAVLLADHKKKYKGYLMEASKMWQRGNAKNRGGEAASYYAERAREFQELARREALKMARQMVENKRISSKDPDAIDLHGTTVVEATSIIQEILDERAVSQSQPLRIITGRGNHSVNQQSVLKPALKKTLTEAGWDVHGWEAGLVVRGRRS